MKTGSGIIGPHFLQRAKQGDATLESPPEQEVLPSQEPATPRNAAQGLNCQTKTLPQKICIYLASVCRLLKTEIMSLKVFGREQLLWLHNLHHLAFNIRKEMSALDSCHVELMYLCLGAPPNEFLSRFRGLWRR